MAALILLPCGALAPQRPEVCGLVVLAAAAAAGADAFRGRRALGASEVKLPASAALVRGQPGAVPVCRKLQLAGTGFSLSAPAGLGFQQVVSEKAHFLPTDRGEFEIRWADLESPSPWGLWSIRRTIPVSCRVRVYPDLSGPVARLLFLNRPLSGAHRQRQLGKGREFEKLREYLPGDPFEDVHWKATARRGRPIVKTFQIERTQEVYVAVDAGRLSARGEVLERFIVAALHLGIAAQRQGDLFGLLTFADQVHDFVRARAGKSHFRACRETLSGVRARHVSPDFKELFSFVQATLRRRALLVVLTSLDDPVLAASFQEGIRPVARRHLVLANVPQLPGVHPVFARPEPATEDGMRGALAGHLFWKRQHALALSLQHLGVRLSVLDPTRMSQELVALYQGVKRRQNL